MTLTGPRQGRPKKIGSIFVNAKIFFRNVHTGFVCGGDLQTFISWVPRALSRGGGGAKPSEREAGHSTSILCDVGLLVPHAFLAFTKVI